MNKDNRQLRIEDFVFPYEKLDAENNWVRLSALVPWKLVEERYTAWSVNNVHPAHPAWMALGALLIQRWLKCSDPWVVKHIGENPYLQYFIGLKEYGAYPFGMSTLVAFRKRFSEEYLAASVPKGEAEKTDDTDDGNRSAQQRDAGPGHYLLPRRHCLSSAQPCAEERRENGGRAVRNDRAEETLDVPQAHPEGLSLSVQKQETQWESDPFNSTQTAAIYPLGHRLYR